MNRLKVALIIILIIVGLGVYYYQRQENTLPGQDQNEASQAFKETGTVLKRVDADRPHIAFLQYDDERVELAFPGDAICLVPTQKPCDHNLLYENDKVTVEGKREGDKVFVSKLEVLESISSLDASKIRFQKSGESYLGTLTLTGYMTVERRVCNPGDMCGQTVDYASFRFSETDNELINEFLGPFQGNSFGGKGVVGLGCYQETANRIYYQNDADSGMIEGTITGEDLQKLLSSNQNNQVKLKLTRELYTSGRGAPDCYSHFRNFHVI